MHIIGRMVVKIQHKEFRNIYCYENILALFPILRIVMSFNLLVIKLRISSTCYTAAMKTCYVKKITCSPMSVVFL